MKILGGQFELFINFIKISNIKSLRLRKLAACNVGSLNKSNFFQ